MLNDTTSHELLSTVAALSHHTASETLKDGTRSLAETLLLVPSGSVRKVRGMVALARNVILRGNSI